MWSATHYSTRVVYIHWQTLLALQQLLFYLASLPGLWMIIKIIGKIERSMWRLSNKFTSLYLNGVHFLPSGGLNFPKFGAMQPDVPSIYIPPNFSDVFGLRRRGFILASVGMFFHLFICSTAPSLTPPPRDSSLNPLRRHPTWLLLQKAKLSPPYSFRLQSVSEIGGFVMYVVLVFCNEWVGTRTCATMSWTSISTWSLSAIVLFKSASANHFMPWLILLAL